MAFIVEQAGGYASTGTQNILDVEPEDLHQRVPFFVGSTEDIKDVERFIKKHDFAEKKKEKN
jgi:fructose-1,6-bisphosphatase I